LTDNNDAQWKPEINHFKDLKNNNRDQTTTMHSAPTATLAHSVIFICALLLTAQDLSKGMVNKKNNMWK